MLPSTEESTKRSVCWGSFWFMRMRLCNCFVLLAKSSLLCQCRCFSRLNFHRIWFPYMHHSSQVLWGMDDVNDGTACRNRVGAVNYYLGKLDGEAYEGAGQSLRQWIYTCVGEKLLSNETDEAFEAELQREYEELVQFQKKKDVHLPTTVYLIRRILGVRDVWEVEHHTCDCQKHFWQPLPPSQWLHPTSDRHVGPTYVCPICEGPRFTTMNEAGGRAVATPISDSV